MMMLLNFVIKFDIKYEIISIEPMVRAFINNMQEDRLRIVTLVQE